MLLAVFVLWHEWRWPVQLPHGPLLAALAGFIVVLAAGTALWRLLDARRRLAARLRSEWRKLASEARRQRAGMPLCLALHFVAWLAGGVQIWMVGWALGYELTLYEAIAIESAAYAGRAVFFFIPAGLVSQEVGLVAAGLVFGLAPAELLALGLVLRLRDLIMAAGLLLWPLLEWRRRGG